MIDILGRIKKTVSGLGNPSGNMSAVTQSEAASLAAYILNFREMYRAHDQTRICLIVPDLAHLASDAPNTAIKAELDKIGTVSVLDEEGVDDGQEDWSVYDLVVVGSNAGGYTFTNDNLDDLITIRVPVLVCNRDVAMHLKMGATQDPSTSDDTEYCETIHNRVMYMVFSSTGNKILFSEATASDRLDMSADLSAQVLMVDTHDDGNTLVVLGWLPMETANGTINKLNDGTDMPAGRLFGGCFVNADKLTAPGQELLRVIARNFTQASITPSIELKAQAKKVKDIDDHVGSPNDVTTDTLHGKIGSDSEMSDVSLFDRLGRIALCVTQWGGFEDELDLGTGAPTPTTLAACVLTPALPAGATVWKAYLIFKFREIYCAGANYISTAGGVEISDDNFSSQITGITIPTGTLDVAAEASAAGDCLIGSVDVSSKVASGTENQFRMTPAMRANADGLKVRDIQIGLQIYFTI